MNDRNTIIELPKTGYALSEEERAYISENVPKVKSLLVKTTSAWLEISKEIYIASYKLNRLAFQRFVTDIGITTSVADKLRVVGKCKHLHNSHYEECLTSTDNWTVLYQLATLDQQQAEQIIKHLKADPTLSLTRELVTNFLHNKPLSQKQITLLSIETDDAFLGSMTKEQLDKLYRAIDTLQQDLKSISASQLKANSRQTRFDKVAYRLKYPSNVAA